MITICFEPWTEMICLSQEDLDLICSQWMKGLTNSLELITLVIGQKMLKIRHWDGWLVSCLLSVFSACSALFHFARYASILLHLGRMTVLYAWLGDHTSFWMVHPSCSVSVDQIFSSFPDLCCFTQVMVLEYRLTYPSGTATAMLINSFHTNTGAELAT